MEEETVDGRCRVVYFCAGSQHHIAQLYTQSSPPPEPVDLYNAPTSSLDHVYNNVRILLDADQGDFDQDCFDTLDLFARTAPTVILVECGRVPAAEVKGNAMAFVRTMTTSARTGHYRQPIMPFALLASTAVPDCLNHKADVNIFTAGAIDMLRSPLTGEDLDRLVGHVKETTRPPAQVLGRGMCHSLVHSIQATYQPPLARHRPDYILTAERKRAIEEAVGQWSFPAHAFTMDELTYAAMFMLEHILRNPDLAAYGLGRPELMTLLLAVRRQYRHEREVRYHNWRHAVDVTQCIYYFLVDVQLCPPANGARRASHHMNAVEHLLSPLDGLILLVSAIGHDVGHPGVNNAFLVACNHQLAYLYNDKSVLENYHCAAYSQLLRRHWPSLYEIPHFRATMISTILATDMQRHFDYMGYLDDFKKRVNNSEPKLSDWKDKDKEGARELLMSLIIKAADISNITRPFNISAHWARILITEFSRQGELESELQIPTCLFGGPPNKEDILAAAQSQKGFIDLFGFPLFRGITDIMPSFSCTLAELETNKGAWERTIWEEKQRREGKANDELAPRTRDSHSPLLRDSVPGAFPADVSQLPSTPDQRQPFLDGSSPSVRHAVNDQRHHHALGIATSNDQRSSTSFLGSCGVPLSPVGGTSRRSSKDVALTQWQELSLFAQQTLGTNSRRASADASWQLQQSYPNSRRCSKDESLTTILVTSQKNTPGLRSSPASTSKSLIPNLPSKTGGAAEGGLGGAAAAAAAAAAAGGSDVSKRHSSTHSQKTGSATNTSRCSIPSSRSHTISSTTATTTDHLSPSTTPSSLAPTDDGQRTVLPIKEADPSIAATEDPFLVPGNWPNDRAGHRSSTPDALPHSPPPPPRPSSSSRIGKSASSPRVVSRMSSSPDLEDVARISRAKEERQLRESRSRSRLRGLRFWKRRREAGATESEPSP